MPIKSVITPEESSLFIEQIIEFLPNPIWVIDNNNNIFLQNSKARDAKDLLKLLELKKDDYEVTFDSRSYIIKSSNYKDKVMLIATDITEEKRKENLAIMGQMVAHLSHEIKNPISSISLLNSTLKKRVLPENIPIVEEIQKSIYRIDRIIKATLMFSKGVEVSKTSFKWSSLKTSIDMAIGYYGYSKNIIFKFPQKDFMMNADKDLLEMLFSNFVTNAIDAIEFDDNEDGVVEFIHTCDKKYHIFHIYDSGLEIENEKELFEAFNSSKVKGNGLGLVLSKQIANAHGGSIKLLNTQKKGFEIKIEV